MSRPIRKVALIYDARLVYDLKVMSGVTLSVGRIAALGATPDFHHGLLMRAQRQNFRLAMAAP